MGQDSTVSIAMGWMVRGSNTSQGEIFLIHPDQPWGPPASYTMGTRYFPGLKWPGRGVDHPPQSIAEVKETVELYLYSTSGPS